jgi:hypothetical protein
MNLLPESNERNPLVDFKAAALEASKTMNSETLSKLFDSSLKQIKVQMHVWRMRCLAALLPPREMEAFTNRIDKGKPFDLARAGIDISHLENIQDHSNVKPILGPDGMMGAVAANVSFSHTIRYGLLTLGTFNYEFMQASQRIEVKCNVIQPAIWAWDIDGVPNIMRNEGKVLLDGQVALIKIRAYGKDPAKDIYAAHPSMPRDTFLQAMQKLTGRRMKHAHIILKWGGRATGGRFMEQTPGAPFSLPMWTITEIMA